MREILFRGKSIGTAEWVEGFYCGGNERKTLRPCIFVYIPDRQSYDCQDIIPETVGQYTGLTDKNGTRIFEGDVMEFVAYGEYYKGVVYIYKGNFGIFCKPPSAHCEASPFLDDAIEKHNAVVIGNVHDNPDLMEVKHDGN